MDKKIILLILFFVFSSSLFGGFPPPIYKNPSSTNGALLQFNGTLGNKVKELGGTGYVKVVAGVGTTSAGISASDISGAVSVSNGGTGLVSLTSQAILIGNSTNPAIGLTCSNGQIPEMSGGVWACGADDTGSGSGVTGPAISSNGAIALFDGTSGAAIKQLNMGIDGQYLVMSGSAIAFKSAPSGMVLSSSGVGGTCTVTGSLITTTGTPGTGQCNYNFATAFSTTPRCWANAYSTATRFCNAANVTTTSLEVHCSAVTTDAHANTDHDIFCVED